MSTMELHAIPVIQKGEPIRQELEKLAEMY
jgi:hypothetical protein